MSFDVLSRMVFEVLRLPEHRSVNFVWHGGEPLLLKRSFFLKALKVQELFRRPGQMISNSVQTNGVLLTDDWCRLFRGAGFHIGLSLDGPPAIHDRSRRDVRGEATFARVCKGVELLRKHQIPFGVLMVVNSETARLEPEEIFDFFLELGIKSFDFLPVRPDNLPGAVGARSADYLTPNEYNAFMIRVFERWFGQDDPEIEVRDLSNLVNILVGASSRVCTLGGGCLGQYFHVEANGDVYHCDKYMGDESYHVGNVHNDGFRDIRGSDRFRRLVADECAKLERLKACPWFEVCNGGCPHDRYIAAKYQPGYDGRCCGSASLIHHIQKRVAAKVPSQLRAEPAGATLMA